ncbi:MAG: CopG family transcriptional regulator [Patulibacter sp.]
MKTKTTIYLPHELKQSISREARRRGTSEAEVIRSSLEAQLATAAPPAPRGGLFCGTEQIAERADELLGAGFGES